MRRWEGSETGDRGDATERGFGGSLPAAVQAAIAEGAAEVGRLRQLVDGALAQIDNLVAADPGHAAPGGVSAAFADVAETSRRQVAEHVARQAEVLDRFNIALFGRTGAGKSTLLSALAELDGGRVSQGESDWTVDVEPVDWQGCRLYDTPGINGWGRTRPRAELEAEARRAVEIADVVLLCFDSQSQQAAEFKKVAMWVQEYGKPVIAVLNHRNLMWRHPARASVAVRKNLSKPVREHASNIRDELAAIGLEGTPVVAIAAQRALDARATHPYLGPDARNHEGRRAEFGTDYLDRWSNLPALEDLLAATVVTGGSQLRMRVLREGLRTTLRGCGENLGEVFDSAVASAQVLDRSIEGALTVLGYPEREDRAMLRTGPEEGDPLTRLEDLRRAAYRSPSTGRLETYVGRQVAIHLDPLRKDSLRKASRCVLDAFGDGRAVSAEEFRREVIDDEQVAAATEQVWTGAGVFLKEELDLTWEEASADLKTEPGNSSFDGRAGLGTKFTSDALRLSGVVTGAVTAAAAVLATTNFWNPVGWVAATVVVGGGLLSGALGWLGKKTGLMAEDQRLAARKEALGRMRLAVEHAYRGIEDTVTEEASKHAWQLHSERLVTLLCEAADLQRGIHTAGDLRKELERLAREIPVSPEPLDVLDGAERLVLDARGAVERPEQVWLGEDWLDDHTPWLEPATAAVQALVDLSEQDLARLSNLLPTTWATPAGAEVRAWLDRLADAGQDLPQATDLVKAAQARLAQPPTVVFLGDYSAGKSSLIKRLLVDDDQDPPSTLTIRADPTTATVEAYDWRHLQLLDTPGLQSGRDGHDEAGAHAVACAALVIVVLHVNLMMGDATVLARLLSRTDSSPAALPRAMFVINRSDEFGVDPLGDPDEFRRRRLRKEAELRALLSAANLSSAPVIHTVSGDAFSLVGDRYDITRADYSDAGRHWDGMAALEAALTATSGVADRMQERAALEEAHSGLFLIRGDLERRSEQAERDKADSQGTLTELDNAIRSGTLLASALEKRAHRLVRAHAERAMADALSASPERLDRAARAASTWWLDPVFTADATSYWTRAQREIDQWTKETGSAIRRSMPAGSQPPLESVRGKRKLPKSKRRGAARKAAAASKAGSGASKALGSRDAVYRIGKTFGHKFKPWGATKGAMRVTRVGAVLSVVTVAFDVYGWVAAVKAAGDAEEYRQDLVSFIEDSIEQVIEKLTRSNEPEGPLTVLEAAVNDCGQDAARLDQAVHQHEASLSTLDHQLALVHDLLAAMPEASTLHEEIA